MLRSRIIPCLLVRNKGLIKTVKFGQSKYVGDPINAVKIFNEKEVDELILLDIDASKEGREPNYKMIEDIAVQCRMPLCYGGGIKTVQQAVRIVNLGAEKVAFSSAAVENLNVLKSVAQAIGVQSVVVVLDYRKRRRKKYELYVFNGVKATGIDLYDFVERLSTLGVGEIVLNSIEKDGTMEGYDVDVVKHVREIYDGPLTVLGGAGSLSDIQKLIQKFKIIGAAAGSLFVFKGKYRAVLINYPSWNERKELYKF